MTWAKPNNLLKIIPSQLQILADILYGKHAMGDSDDDEGQEGLAKNCLKQLLKIAQTLTTNAAKDYAQN